MISDIKCVYLIHMNISIYIQKLCINMVKKNIEIPIHANFTCLKKCFQACLTRTMEYDRKYVSYKPRLLRVNVNGSSQLPKIRTIFTENDELPNIKCFI